jgi:MarR family transcriptional regulator, temperature-dependent positive regulator of motility
MELSEKDFHILDALDSREITTQRELAEHAGVSLGQVNYVLRSLLEKGLVKIGNFRRSSRKISYVYHLTPKGLDAKAGLAGKFVMSRLREYHDIRDGLTEKLVAIENERYNRIFFVGPSVVGGLLDSIIKEKGLNMTMAGQCGELKDLKGYDQESFDIAILFDGNGRKLRAAARLAGISSNKLLALW